MGRVKLKIKRLENSTGRQTTYAKRKNGILKKANELSILCDIDIILLMFSPTGKPSLCCGRKSMEEVIAKFAQLTPQERAKRKLESLEALKKTFKKLDHDVNIQDFMGSTQTAEDLAEQARQLKDELADAQQRLSYWTDPEKIDSLEHLGQMEDSLGKSLDVLRSRKENMEKQHNILQETAAQIQSKMQMPYRVSLEDHYQPLPWNPNNDNTHVPFTEDPSFNRPREMECSASSSFADYSSYLGLGKGSQADAFRDDAGFLSELSQSSPLGHLVSGQYSFPSYSSNLLATDTKYPTSVDMNLQNTVHLEAQTSYGNTQPVLDTNNNVNWGSTSAPYSETIHGSWASNCVPFADTMQMHGGWTSTPGPWAATTTNGSWASTPGPYPVALFDEHYQVSLSPFTINKHG